MTTALGQLLMTSMLLRQRFHVVHECSLLQPHRQQYLSTSHSARYIQHLSLNYQEPVKLPSELDESMLDIGLGRIRHNSEQIATDVTEGMDFCLRFLKE